MTTPIVGSGDNSPLVTPARVTTRGPRDVRETVIAYLRATLPPLVPQLRTQWADPTAFPPAGPDGESELPPDDAWWPYEGHPVDRWPVINCSIEESSTSWGEVDTTTDFDSVVYWTTYSCSAYVWVNVDGRQQAVDVRDDLQVAMRVALLGQQLSADPPMTVLRNRYRDVYGSPLPAKGQRFTIAGRSAFSVRVEERISRVALVTVAASSDIEVDLDVTSVPLGDHPALQ
jgi:hypothetical protein